MAIAPSIPLVKALEVGEITRADKSEKVIVVDLTLSNVQQTQRCDPARREDRIDSRLSCAVVAKIEERDVVRQQVPAPDLLPVALAKLVVTRAKAIEVRQ